MPSSPLPLPFLRRHLLPWSALCGLAWAGLASPAEGLTLKLDYSHDATAEDFFSTFPAAKAALEQAALDLGGWINVLPTAISSDYFLGTSGAASVAFDLNLAYRNPSQGWIQQVEMPFVAAGEVIVYVGSQALEDNTLAYSEIATVKATITTDQSGTPAERQAATTLAAAAAEAAWGRGGQGPVFNSLSGPTTLGGTSVDYLAKMGAIASSVWFDTDTNNDGDADTAGQLAAYWHFDHTTPPPASKFDFYSTALHELLHGIGVGTAQAHGQLLGETGGETTWFGAHAQALNNGSAFGLADPDGQHIREGLISRRLSDGLPQEALMDPTIGVGQRKELTEMDLAFLYDLGWAAPAPVPEPGILAWLGLALFLRRRRP